MKIKRTIVYIDGFNLYFGLRDKGWRRYYWLNLWELGKNLLKPDQALIKVKYFTSKIHRPKGKHERQARYFEALDTVTGVERFYGIYDMITAVCENCGGNVGIPNEKMTDVQIASHLICDAHKDNKHSFDVALIVSGDRDLVPAIELVKGNFPHKRIIAVFPPMRSCDDLRYCAHAYYHITEPILKKSLFPIEIPIADSLLKCPEEWQEIISS